MTVVHAGFLSHFVQCLSSKDDVLSLLTALPRDELDAPLAALRTLLTTPSSAHKAPWPHVCIEDMDSQHISTVLTALPTIRLISIRNLDRLCEVLREATNEPDSSPYAAAIAFATRWGHKVTTIALWMWPQDNSAEALATIIRHCTSICAIGVSAVALDPACIKAAIFAAQHAKKIHYASRNGDVYDCGDWRQLFGAWLASGHATELRLDGLTSDDNIGFARAIAAATSLTSLKLTNTPDLLQGLVEAAVPLMYITQLRLVIDHEDGALADALLTNWITLPALRVLKLRSEDSADVTFVLQLLPRLVMLDELSFETCTLRSVPALREAPAPCRLRILSTRTLQCDGDDDACLDLYAWAARSPYLQVVNVEATDAVWRKPVLFGRQLRRWIQDGVDRISLQDCDVDDKNIIAIAVTKTIAKIWTPGRHDFTYDSITT
ncbi:hypothetical protein SPRG_16111 [Saprolegnia parasitica CBS 223.65]|uniref:F-box domain-containing protein n=1 Tax=Saprolegnia parasitica (strain CBS 223.65) TaxID=695850 RepID=A0A067BJE6_SAPPC|nr:hypothetical protein SPRG_16111 [Saprolegnia parasitica CBS 223.65]KDO18559.1 hypothetical protein SPRG_16111 [Saprolegnia parasitica CBS 223.65]|eukprot:XP_012210729.1 hypothetical protein SPRG_16111 [Saprolegnia parasitica CBS 223.65]